MDYRYQAHPIIDMRYLAAPTSVHNIDISRRKPHTTPGHAFNIRVIVVPAPRRVVIVLDFKTSNMPEMLASTSSAPPGVTATSAPRTLPWASELSSFWAQAACPDTSTANKRPAFFQLERILSASTAPHAVFTHCASRPRVGGSGHPRLSRVRPGEAMWSS